MTHWEFEVRRFGKRVDVFIVEEGATEQEARSKARRHLERGETLGKVIRTLEHQ